MAIEYIGELLSDEHLSVTPAVLSRFCKGEPLKITIEALGENIQDKLHDKKPLDAATQRFLSRLENAPRLGQIKGDLSREDIYEEMADERF